MATLSPSASFDCRTLRLISSIKRVSSEDTLIPATKLEFGAKLSCWTTGSVLKTRRVSPTVTLTAEPSAATLTLMVVLLSKSFSSGSILFARWIPISASNLIIPGLLSSSSAACAAQREVVFVFGLFVNPWNQHRYINIGDTPVLKVPCNLLEGGNAIFLSGL